MSRRLVVLVLLVLGLGACQTVAPRGAPAPGRLDGILAREQLRVGLTGSQPPLNMRNRQGEIVGLDVDIATALADAMQLELALVPLPFAELLPALERGDVDLVISGMTITVERNARAAFVGPYLVSGKSVLTRSPDLAQVGSARELDRADLSVAALAGSTSEAWVREMLPSATLRATPGYDGALELVRSGAVDALVADFPFCALALLRFPDDGLRVLPAPLTVEPLGIALPAGDPLLVNLVQNYLHSLDETGLLARLKAHWFSDGAWVAELP